MENMTLQGYLSKQVPGGFAENIPVFIFPEKPKALLDRRYVEVSKMIRTGELSIDSFFQAGLSELEEALKDGGTFGEMFDKRDKLYSELLAYIHRCHPEFDTFQYENLYDRITELYSDDFEKQKRDEKAASLKKAKEIVKRHRMPALRDNPIPFHSRSEDG
jgi:hypothetical protein